MVVQYHVSRYFPALANWMTKSLEEVCGRPVETIDYDLETKFQQFLPFLYDGLYIGKRKLCPLISSSNFVKCCYSVVLFQVWRLSF